jgi:Rrf2 family protein
MGYSLAFTQAVYVTLFIADKIHQGIYEFVPARTISENLDMARPSVVKILQGLSRAGLVETQEGAKGGVKLSRKPEQVSLLDVFVAIEGNKNLFRIDYGITSEHPKPAVINREVQVVLKGADQLLHEYLSGITFLDIIKKIS